MTKSYLEIRIFFLCSLLSLMSIPVGAETGKSPDPGAVQRGTKIYKNHCIRCHQKDGIGQTPIPWGVRHPEFTPAMPLNETSHAWHHGDKQLASTILNGLPGRMPAFSGVLSKNQANDAVAYIKSLWGPRILACQGPKHMSCMQH